MPIGDSPESLSPAMLAGVMLVGGLGAMSFVYVVLFGVEGCGV